MSAVAGLIGRLDAIRAEHTRQDEEDELRYGGRGFAMVPRIVGLDPADRELSEPGVSSARGKPTFDDYDDRIRKGGGRTLGSGPRPAARRRDGLPPGSARVRGLAGGGQAAVVKVVSFAAGSTRVGALAAYVSKEREGGVLTEDQDGAMLDRAGLAAKLDGWKASYSNRKPSKDVATIRFKVNSSSNLDRAEVEAGVRQSLDGHRHALRVAPAGEGGFEVFAVVAAEGRSSKTANGKVKRQARYRFDRKFEMFIAGKVATEIGGEVEATILGTSHGRDGAAYRLGKLIENGPATDELGRELRDGEDVRTTADAWKKTLGSRKARDAMHLVLSAKPGTDATAFRQTARDFLAGEFAGHDYFFAVHKDRGHLHAHAVILIKGADGQRLRPDISTFSDWRTRYAEIARAHGINMVATRRSDRASPPPFDQAEAALTARGVAPDHIRRKVEAKRTNAIHVPVREEGRRRAHEGYHAWKAFEAEAATPAARQSVEDHLTRLATSVNLSHSMKGREIAAMPIEDRGGRMMRATADYLSAEFNRANQVLNRALPMLEGADKAEATQLANAYLASLARQVEAVQAVETGRFAERAEAVQQRDEDMSADAAGKAAVLRATATEAERNLGPDTPPADTRALDAAALEVAANRAERTAARDRAEADAMAREGQAFRANPGSPAPADPNLPSAGEELREEQELLIDRIETQRLTHTRVHRQ